ncbi:MAG: uncharacterized protein A8A55_2177 [Amphiamblys sp. WSBS2006]|nr:MAG: uncharacterized protein A8A55_2177 [Amphiamblys sp. WSBS2006]
MRPGAIGIWRLENVFFVFTDKNLFLVPGGEYKYFQQNGKGFIYTKKRHIPEVASRDTGKVICIICHEEAAPEDFVSPLCQQMHFVLCEACMEDIQKRADKREVVCPYCEEKQSGKTSREGILGVLFSSVPYVTRLTLGPGIKVATAMRLTLGTKTVLGGICVSNTLFFGLMSRTTVEIKGRISLFRSKPSHVCCLGEPEKGDSRRVSICVGGYSVEQIEQIHTNISTMPKSSIAISTRKIHAADNGICVFLNLCAVLTEHTPDVSLSSSKRIYIEEIIGEGNKRIWMGEVKHLVLARHAIEMLPRLRINEGGVMEELRLRADSLKYIDGILRIKNGGICVGRVKNLHLAGYAVRIFPRLGFHEGNEMEGLFLSAEHYSHIAGIPQADNNSFWAGKVKSLRLEGYALEIFPKLRFHEENKTEEFSFGTYAYEPIDGVLGIKKRENWIRSAKKLSLEGRAIEILPRLGLYKESEMEEIVLGGDCSYYISEILEMERNSGWMGKVKNLRLEGCAVDILPKLVFHGENVMEVLDLYADNPGYITGILGKKSKSIWMGMVKTLRLEGYAAEVLPKLGFCIENVMEELILDVYDANHITKILKTRNGDICVGMVKNLRLEGHAVEILPKLFFQQENEMEVFSLSVKHSEHTAGILRMGDNSIWVGKVKKMKLVGYAVDILPKLDLHEENEMDMLEMYADHLGHITGVLRTKRKCIWMGMVKTLRLEGYAVEVLPKLGFPRENEMEVLEITADRPGHIAEILKTENDDICVGMVKSLVLELYAVEILPKLDFHQENEMDVLDLYAGDPGNIAGILGMENECIWVGKVKKMNLVGDVVDILPKLDFHEENEMDVLELSARDANNIAEIFWTKRKSIWVGRVKTLKLKEYAVGILPKLLFRRKNGIEMLELTATKAEHIARIQRAKKNSIWVGRVENLRLGWYAADILPKLRFHKENVMEGLEFIAPEARHISRTLEMKKKSIWIGRVKDLFLSHYAIEILPKLRLHEDNEMEKLVLNTDKDEHIAGILAMKNYSIWLWGVKELRLEGHAKLIENKLGFMTIESDSQDENEDDT